MPSSYRSDQQLHDRVFCRYSDTKWKDYDVGVLYFFRLQNRKMMVGFWLAKDSSEHFPEQTLPSLPKVRADNTGVCRYPLDLERENTRSVKESTERKP
ncbi:hypothetical protein L1887_20592 [Cichorium endivia]|nr:hypothetical protein L1887_20592 [Cichorium endivia]